MQTVTVLKSAFVNSLHAQIRANLLKYGWDEPWISEIGARSQREMPTSVHFKSALALVDPDVDNHKDTENAIRLHEALPQLTPMQARDPRLWTRFTRVEYWDYMRKRWPLEKHIADEGKAVRFIDARYFVTQSQSRALLRNGMARLRWTAKLSYDASRKDRYELTAVLLSTLDITQQILERGFGRAPEVSTGFLEFLLRHKAALLTGGDTNRAHIRHLAKFLNLQGACVFWIL